MVLTPEVLLDCEPELVCELMAFCSPLAVDGWFAPVVPGALVLAPAVPVDGFWVELCCEFELTSGFVLSGVGVEVVGLAMLDWFEDEVELWLALLLGAWFEALVCDSKPVCELCGFDCVEGFALDCAFALDSPLTPLVLALPLVPAATEFCDVSPAALPGLPGVALALPVVLAESGGVEVEDDVEVPFVFEVEALALTFRCSETFFTPGTDFASRFASFLSSFFGTEPSRVTLRSFTVI